MSQEKEGLITYRDYSLKKRSETKKKDVKLSALQQKKLKDEDKQITKLQSFEIDIDCPLSIIDWTNIANLVPEINALAWVQILPTGQKSAFPFQFNCIHILPSSKIPFPKIPLDIMIKNKITFLKKQQK